MGSQTGQFSDSLKDETLPATLDTSLNATELAEHKILMELLAKPGSFAFAQAINIAERHLRCNGTLPIAQANLESEANTIEASLKSAFRYTVNPNLSFPPGDIASLAFINDEAGQPMRTEVMLNLMGLHGAGSPLPAYFTEYVAQHQDEQGVLRDFFDVFNHQLVNLLQLTWAKYRYHIQYRKNASDILSKRFFSFIGLGHSELRKGKNLNWARLLPYMGLIAFSGEAAGSLESILRHYFGHPQVSIVPCMRRRVVIPKEQLCSLGSENSTLSVDCLIGETVTDHTGKFRILIDSLKWDRFLSFLPNAPIFSELYSLVHFILRSRLHFDVELHLLPEEIPPLYIGEKSVCRLGWSTWAGDDGDGIVSLESRQLTL